MSKRFRLFVYASLLFLCWYLWRHDFLVVPKVRSFGLLSASFVFLVGGFLGGALAWNRILSRSGVDSSPGECVASMGLSIFGKYIPGKLWMILGRAAYIAQRRGESLATLSAISLNDQFIGLWVGLVLGTFGLMAIGGVQLFGWLLLFSWISLSVVVFSPWGHQTAERLLKTFLKRSISLPRLKISETCKLLPWFLGYWTTWAIGFSCFVSGLSGIDQGMATGLAFPLAGTLGIIAIFAPGGLGIREGILTAYLKLAGLPLPEATTIAVASRLWFLVGESAFFVLGLVANRHELRSRSAPPSARRNTKESFDGVRRVTRDVERDHRRVEPE
ncbi:MAG: flippase-like domain-containing protein [Acidobacteriota bacterium]|nr:flippase-like domain-containing protein [Acidobacteriota bacterium]